MSGMSGRKSLFRDKKQRTIAKRRDGSRSQLLKGDWKDDIQGYPSPLAVRRGVPPAQANAFTALFGSVRPNFDAAIGYG
jgi:hypothetical protein